MKTRKFAGTPLSMADNLKMGNRHHTKEKISIWAIALVVTAIISALFYARVALAATIAPEIRHYWNLDDGTGTIAQDSSAAANKCDMDLINEPVWLPASGVNGALKFKATQLQYAVNLSVPDMPSFPFTVMMWVWPTGYSRTDLLRSDGSWALQMLASGELSLEIKGESGGKDIKFANAVPLNKWTHIALVFDDSGLTLYKDGAMQSSTRQSLLPKTGTGAVYLGGCDIYGVYFNGVLDEVKVYRGTVFEADIIAEASAAPVDVSPPAEPSPVARWNLDGTLADSSGNGNNLIMSDAVYADAAKNQGLSLDGISQYAEADIVSPSPYPSYPFSVMFWVRNDDYPYAGDLIRKNGSWALQLDNGLLSLEISGKADIAGATKISSCGSWTHVAVTFSGDGTAVFYRNGSFVYSLPGADAPSDGTNVICVGGNAFAGTYFKGILDEIKIYKDVLEADVIKYEYDSAVKITADTVSPVFISANVKDIPDASVDSPIKVTFCEDIKLGAGTISASPAIQFNASVRYNILTITPTAPLAYDTKYTVTIPTDAVQDMSGNYLDSEVSFGFETSVAPISTPVAHWKFDSVTGQTAVDESSYGNDLTLIGAPTVVTAIKNGGLSFNGINQYARKQGTVNIVETPFTVAFWIKLSGSSGGYDDIVRFENSWAISVAPNGRLNLEISKMKDVSSGIILSECGTWMHVAVTFTRGMAGFFKNGELSAAVSGLPLPSSGTGNIYIGGNPSGNYLSGIIDDLKIYNYAIQDAATIKANEVDGVTIPSDTSPPQVVSINPENNAVGVPADQDVSVSFCEDINLVDPNGITVNPTVAFNAVIDKNILNIDLTSLTNDTQYTVTIVKSAIEDLSGNPLSAASDISVSFKTCVSPLSQPVAMWKFDKSLSDTGYYGNNGLNFLTGTPSYAPAADNYGLILNAATPFGVKSATTGIVSAPFTMELWVKHNNYNICDLLRKDGSWALQINSQSNVSFEITGKSDITPVSPKTVAVSSCGAWTHLAVTFSGGILKFYKNGKFITSSKVSYPQTGQDNIYIGSKYPDRVFDGIVDDVKIFNRALADDEISNEFSNYALPPADTVSPIIILTDPVAGAVTHLKRTITFTFCEDIQYEGGITVSPGFPFIVNVNGNLLTISHTTELSYDTVYQISIPASAIKDAAGNYMEAYSFSFKTCAAPEENPVALWSFDNTLTDSSGNRNDLEFCGKGAPSWINGPVGAASLDLNAYYYQYGRKLGTNGIVAVPFSIGLWIKPRNYNVDFVRKEGSWGLQINSSGVLSIEVSGKKDIVAISPKKIIVPKNVWTHIAVTYDIEKEMTVFYKNGKEFAYYKNSPFPSEGLNNIYIGGSDIAPTKFLDGALDEVKIFNRHLTAAEIAGEFNFGNPPPPDFNPPVIISADPAIDATEVPVNKIIRLTFSENVTAVNGVFESIWLKNSRDEIVSVNCSISGGRTLEITPAALSPGVKYTVRVPPEAVMDYDGNFLENGYSFSFTTAGSVPGPVQNFVVEPGDKKVFLSWQPPSSNGGMPITGYNIYRDGSVIITISDMEIYYVDTSGIVNGTSYNYQISAVNDKGEGVKSPPITVTPKAFSSSGQWIQINAQLDKYNDSLDPKLMDLSVDNDAGTGRVWTSDSDFGAAELLENLVIEDSGDAAALIIDQ